jgi:hypothetical protein
MRYITKEIFRFTMISAGLAMSSLVNASPSCPGGNESEPAGNLRALQHAAQAALNDDNSRYHGRRESRGAGRSEHREQSDDRSISNLRDHDRRGIDRWLGNSLTRGGGGMKNRYPDGNRISYCAGAGCPLKIPFQFSSQDMREVWAEIYQSRKRNNCLKDSQKCELLGLQFATRKMDQIVKRARLDGISDLSRYNSKAGSEGSESHKWFEKMSPGQQYLRDCVDHATNGTSFLIVLANNGMMKHHRAISPGETTFHFFTRLQSNSGTNYRFDLYSSDRTSFNKIPGVVAL